MSVSLRQLSALVRDHDVPAVVSDLDGVLRVFDPALWPTLDALAGAAEGAVFSAVLGNPFLDDVVRGRGTHRQWRERARVELVDSGSTPEAAHAAIETWASTPARIDHEVLEELERLRAAGIGVFVLTNGTDRVPQELEELGLAPFLGEDRRFLLNTADLGAAKPEPDAFARAHARLDDVLGTTLRPDQVAFLDDSERHVRAAARFGWHGLVHVPAETGSSLP